MSSRTLYKDECSDCGELEEDCTCIDDPDDDELDDDADDEDEDDDNEPVPF